MISEPSSSSSSEIQTSFSGYEDIIELDHGERAKPSDSSDISEWQYIDLEDDKFEDELLKEDEISDLQYKELLAGDEVQYLGTQSLDSDDYFGDHCVVTRNGPLKYPQVELPLYGFKDMTLRPGKTVELTDGDFLRITAIVGRLDDLPEVLLRGWRLRRNKGFDGLLEMKRNEVTMRLHVDEDDPRAPCEQGVEEVSVQEATRIRRLVMTNKDWPAESFNEATSSRRDLTDIVVFNEYHLVCRWQYIIQYRTAKHRLKTEWSEKMLVKIREKDAGGSERVSDEELRRQWRGDTERGGSYVSGSYSRRRATQRTSSPITPAHPVSIDLTEDVPSARLREVMILDPPCPTPPSSAGSSQRPAEKRLRFGDPTGRPDPPTLDTVLPLRQRACINLCDDPIPLSYGRPLKNKDQHTLRTQELSNDFEKNVGQMSTAKSSAGKQPQEDPRKHCGIRTQERGQVTTAGKKYTLGDCFSGCGGMSCAAQLAGLAVTWAFDKDPAAMESYMLNHSNTRCYLEVADEFVSRKDESGKVDIQHISPPCQYFSPAHTIMGKDDEDNTAALFAIPELLKKARARVVTFEQTAGLLRGHLQFFNTAIHMFTSHGFSVRWKIVNFAHHGLPQARQRLIIIASW